MAHANHDKRHDGKTYHNSTERNPNGGNSPAKFRKNIAVDCTLLNWLADEAVTNIEMRLSVVAFPTQIASLRG